VEADGLAINGRRTADGGYTVAEAARRLQVSEKTIRRHIKRGALQARMVHTVRGAEYRLDSLDIQEVSTVAQPGQPRDTAVQLELAAEAMRLATEQARVIAAKDEEIAHLQQERFELAGRLGYFQAELEHARETIKALHAPASAPVDERAVAPSPPASERRPWWRIW